MANWLTDMKRQRMVNALKSPATQWQAMASNAPIGAVGAPSGLLAPPQPKPTNYLGGLLGAASMVPGIGDAAGIAADARMYLTDPKSRTPGNFALSGLGALPFVPALATAFHASPYKFDAFDLSKAGAGEGMQAYGHGLYLAESPAVSGKGGAYYNAFKDHPATKETGGPYAYTVDIPDESIAKMLDWEKPLNQQAPEVKAAVDAMKEDARAKLRSFPPSEIESELAYMEKDKTGWDLYNWASLKAGSESAASEYLRTLGIPGIRYPAGEYRGGGQGLANYVIFDDKLPKILKRE